MTHLSNEGKSSCSFPSKIQQNLHMLYILSGVGCGREKALYISEAQLYLLSEVTKHAYGGGGGAHGNRNPLDNQIYGHSVKYITSRDWKMYSETSQTRSVLCSCAMKSSHLSSCILVWRLCYWAICATGRILVKMDIWVCFENVSRKFKFH
jgi:hypothetical protein